MDTLSRRHFLRQSFAFSALASLGSLHGLASAIPTDTEASEILMVGDWGYENYTAQTAVAAAMRQYAQQHSLRAQALLMLGDNWYGSLEGGAHSPRWQTQFEQMYPVDTFSCPAYAILGNHDYQKFPESKVDAELEYARMGNTRWIMPSRWYTFTYPQKDPVITFICLDANLPGMKRGADRFLI